MPERPSTPPRARRTHRPTKRRALGLLSSGALVLAAAPVAGAQAKPCSFICTPVVLLAPAMSRSHLFGGPRVRDTNTGQVTRLSSNTNFEAVVVVSSKTAIPRLGIFGSVAWIPNALASRNPFTQYTASDLGETVHANTPYVTAGASVAVLAKPTLGGWADLGVNVNDLFSPAARPNATSDYTQKLDLQLIAHLYPFSTLAGSAYMHRVSIYGLLDYVATGLPKKGDEVPLGRVYVDDARPTSLILGLMIPITPEPK